MTEIIYLVHRLPFPPNKGDKIRSFHLLRYLAERFEVHMGCFVDDEADLKYIDNIRAMCKSICAGSLQPTVARLKSLKGLVTGQALTLPYYFDRSLAEWIDRTLEQNEITAVVAFSSPMGQYVLGRKYSGLKRVMDFVDIDSDKWKQYANKSGILGKWIYSREARHLAEFENAVTQEFDAAIFVSDNETDMFSRQIPDCTDKLHTICNGVDTDYFDPGLTFESPFDYGSRPIVFTGIMDYWPNVDAMCWFARDVFPNIRKAVTGAELWIVGASPTKEVFDLASIAGVFVTGRVPDVRPYLRYAAVAIAPLRIARGVQNKVLEALAMGCNVVSSPEALAGLERAATAPVQRATCSGEWVDYLVQAQQDASCNDRRAGPAYVRRYYDWNANLSLLEELLVAEDDIMPLPHPDLFGSTHGD